MISPQAGTPDASPTTQISILGVAPSQIRSVRLSGAASGAHTGALHRYSANRGASFVLTQPLTQGERVTVRVRLAGRPTIAFAFTVAHLAKIPPVINLPARQPDKLDHFVSRPDLLPPHITVLKQGAAGAGDFFITPLPSPIVHPESNNAISINPVGPGGPMILDKHGKLVWFQQLPTPLVATNFRPQSFAGHEVLTWWQGPVTLSAFGTGEGVIADLSYRTLRTVTAGNGYTTDLHEFVLTPSGDALLTSYSPVLVHLAGTAPGVLSPLLDSIAQEVDVRTGLVVWEWHSFGHIPLADSYATPANSADYDAYHLNSLQLLPGNRLLVSARDTSAVYLVDRAGGRILWKLGGKASSFRLRRGARFYFQHDAQMLGPDKVSLFDDEAGPPFEGPASRALFLKLDLRHRSAAVLRSYRRPGNHTLAQSEGSVQQLPGGNVFVGFGSTQFFSEFSATGKLLFDARLPVDDGSYREFRVPWSATPTTRPAAAARRISPTRVSVYASWNGATTVARWQVLAGPNPSAPKPTTSVNRSGFETRIDLSSSAGSFAVRALSPTGRVLATSKAVQPS
ncbi:MAG TPA: arylsulfotransferase family protein [Solirubrobacteraceae bacterium]